jgi:hypothetical protein
MGRYEELKRSLARGWNTWNNRSVLSHVLLPYGFAVNICLREYASNGYLKEALVGRDDVPEGGQRMSGSVERIYLGAHAYDGSYTELRIEWRGVDVSVQSAAEDDELFIVITPHANQKRAATLVVESGILWNRPGSIRRTAEGIAADLPGRTVLVRATAAQTLEPGVQAQAPYLAMRMEHAIGICTGRARTLPEIREIVDRGRSEHERRQSRFGQLSEPYDAMQSSLAWDTIYDPRKDRVITPVSRIWNLQWGGYAVYCWDMYLAAYMAAFDNKELAYANAIEITAERTAAGFVPNCAAENGFTTLDRSQPPLGSFTARELYRKFREKWLIETLFDDLYAWNGWYCNERQIEKGLLAWGTKPYEPILDNYWERAGVGEVYGAAMESGLDNSPMYDGTMMDPESHCMMLADVGLISLFILDCDALRDLALDIGRDAESNTLRDRAELFAGGLRTLWCEEAGIYLNKRTDTGEFSRRISPTSFYPLLTGRVPSEMAERMVREHFFNPDEFWGEWMLPSISRVDPAYPEQEYWRGRIWAPMNFLVYLGLRRCQAEGARKCLAEKSVTLLLKEWRANRHVHENYSAETGEGCDVASSDKYYHWGGLLSLIGLMEAGY